MTDEQEFDSNLAVYLKEQEDQRAERHEENIQILAALGILGGYITAISTGLELSSILSFLIHVIAASNFVFLIYKLLVNSPLPLFKSVADTRIDSFVSGLYIVSVVGFAAILIVVAAANQLEVPLTNIGDIVIGIVIIGSFSLFFLLMYILGTKKAELAETQAAILNDELPRVLSKLEKEGAIPSGRKNALIDRTQALLNSDGVPHWFLMHGMLTNRAEPLRLYTGDREQLLNILDRVDRKANHGEYDEEDLELIDAIISRAEERAKMKSNLQENEIDVTSD